MKKIIFALLLSTLAGCSNSPDWHVGNWEFDIERSKEILGELTVAQQNVINMASSFMKDVEVNINENSFTMKSPFLKEPLTQDYVLVTNEDGTIKLDAEKRDLELGKDENGVYHVMVDKVKVTDGDGNVYQDETHEVKIYLKKAD